MSATEPRIGSRGEQTVVMAISPEPNERPDPIGGVILGGSLAGRVSGEMNNAALCRAARDFETARWHYGQALMLSRGEKRRLLRIRFALVATAWQERSAKRVVASLGALIATAF